MMRRYLLGLFAAAVALASAVTAAAARDNHTPHANANAQVLAHDRQVVSAKMHRCRYFRPNGCPFGPTAVTGDGNGRLLYAIDLKQSAGSCADGIVWFFDAQHLLDRTGQLAPDAQTGLPGVKAAGLRHFRVYYVVNRSPQTDCAHWGNGGTDPYLYRFNGSRMVLVSGKSPNPPALLARGFKRLP